MRDKLLRRFMQNIFSKAIGRKTVSDKITDVYARKRIDFGSNSVLSKIPNFMDFGLSPANTPDKINSIIFPTTRVVRLKNGSGWLAPRHDIEEVMAERVIKAKEYSNYILNEFETMKFLSRKIFL